MEEDSNKHLIVEKGVKYYSKHTLGCFDVINQAIPEVLSLINSIKWDVILSNPSVSDYHLTDYGCADGGTDLPLWKKVFPFVLSKLSNLTLIWNDQVTNDWTSLEQIVTSDSEFSKYRYELSKTSFYNSISTSVIFGFSASALHWLQNKPKFDSLSLSNSLFAIHGNLLAFDNQLRVLLMKQAQNDWILILKQRAKELVRGGKLYLIVFTQDENGYYLGNTPNVKENMLSSLNQLWYQMSNEGIISETEYKNTLFCNYYRTTKELRYPFENDVVPELKLLKLETKIVQCPFHQSINSKENQMNGMEYAKWFVPTVKSWSFSTFVSGLNIERSSVEKKEIVEKLFKRYEEMISKSPTSHGMDYVHAYISIEKI